MRIALVSPYSWTYPGGVTRHIEALAEQFIASGHDVRVLAPYDPADALSARLHRGAWPQDRPIPDHLVPLGRTFGFPANGAVSNLSPNAESALKLRRGLRAYGPDVVHVHEPVAPVPGWDATVYDGAPVVGTFHCYSTNKLTNGIAANVLGARRRLNHLAGRIAFSEAAAWTARRFFGGHYTIVPNGVDLDPFARAHPLAAPGAPVRLVFVGQAVERKGLPVLLRAFEALREHIHCELTVVGVGADEIAPMLLDPTTLRGGLPGSAAQRAVPGGVRALGKVDEATKRAALRE